MADNEVLLTGLAAVGMAVIHFWGGDLPYLEIIPRRRWISAISGLSVAYIFLHLMPAMEPYEEALSGDGGLLANVVAHPVKLMALLGVVVFYGLERAVLRHRGGSDGDTTESAAIFWLHIAMFAFYNVLFGYLLLHREDRSLADLVLYVVAIGLHFLLNDYSLRRHHGDLYHQRGRWVLAAAILFGWFAGTQVELSSVLVGLLFGFVAGAIMLNVLKEELPEADQSRFSAFAVGALAYTTLLVVLG